MTQIGQTISGDDFKKRYGVGQTISGGEFRKAYGNTSSMPVSFPASEPAEVKEGFMKRFGKSVISAERGVGESIASGFVPLTNSFKEAQTSADQASAYGVRILQAIRKSKEEGKDTSGLERAYEIATGQSIYDVYKELNPAAEKTTNQALGEVAGVGLDVLSAGSYGAAAKGAKTGQLLTKSKIAAKIASKAGLGVVKKQAAKIPLAQKVAEGAVLGYGADVSSNMRSGDSSVKPGIGTTLGVGIPFASALIGGLTKRIAGFTTGSGKDVIQRAIDNPDAVDEAVKKFAKSPESQQDLVDVAKDSVVEYLQKRSEEYGNELSKLKLSKPVKKEAIVKDFIKEVKVFGGRLDDEGELFFESSKLTKTDRNNLLSVWDDIRQWKNVTPQGLDDLRQNIGNYISEFKAGGNTRADVILGNVKSSLTKYIDDAAPGYKKILQDYGQKTEIARNLLSELSQSGKAKPSTQLRQILNIFKKDPQVLKNLQEVMGEKNAKKLLNEIAGAILTGWTPEGKVQNWFRLISEGGAGVAAFAAGGVAPGLATLATGAALASPRIVGKAATATGKVVRSGATTAARRSAIKATNP